MLYKRTRRDEVVNRKRLKLSNSPVNRLPNKVRACSQLRAVSAMCTQHIRV